MNQLLWLLFGAWFLLSCKHPTPYSYTIADFRPSLQPHLRTIVEVGVAGLTNDYTLPQSDLASLVTDDELNQLSRSEHPVLRSEAVRIMMSRPGFNRDDVMLSHLGDTAYINGAFGEFGIHMVRVTDYFLEHSVWSNRAKKNKAIEEVLMKYNMLRSACTVLSELPLEEKFYPCIRSMALRERMFDEKEYILYALARYKKASDTALIRTTLLENIHQLGTRSFNLIRDFPNPSYHEILDRFFRNEFLRRLRDVHTPQGAFLNAVAAYKDPESFLLLKKIMFLYFGKKSADADQKFDELKNDLALAIWENRCPLYETFMPAIRERVQWLNTNRLQMDLPDSSNSPLFW